MKNGILEQLTLLLEELPANPSASQDSEKDSQTQEETSRLSIAAFLTDLSLGGLSGKTSPAYCQATEDGTLVPSSGRWLNSGMGSRIECLTLSTSEFHSDADVCSLSDTLEIGDVPQRYFLSATACKGILRRAEKRGKTLPRSLQRALEATVKAAERCEQMEVTLEEEVKL